MKKTVGLCSLIILAACSFAPDYQTPTTAILPAYKEKHNWVQAQPVDAIERGAWWKIFHDPQLDALEDLVTQANQNLKIALAQYDQARAAASQARAAYFPTITGDVAATRQKNSENLANRASITRFNTFDLGADLSYEIDLWGRVRNLVAANEDQADASAADLAGVVLSLHAELADDYFALRGDDMAQQILDKTVAVDQEALTLTTQRMQGGVASEMDVDQATTQLENARTQATDMRLQRAQLEHAIAILVGCMPAEFNLVPAALPTKVPHIDPGLPSTLLQRRPDIAAAERRVAAANAEIGVTRAAWFPTFTLTGSIGFESASAMSWLDAPSRFWSLGPSAMMPIFDGGAIDALNEQARAAYDGTVASYRQTVLTAHQEIEDNLVALHRLSQEKMSQDAATAAAARTLSQANNLYINGATTYLDVVVAQNTELQAKLAQVTLTMRRLTADVQLIKALGGGWTRADIKAVE